MNKRIVLVGILLLCFSFVQAQQWSLKHSQDWYEKQPWLVGCNFLPSTAINQIEMWQNKTWDAKTNKRELALAADLGFNTVRVYLHDLVYKAEKNQFLKKIDEFLTICDELNIKTIFVFFDDCHFAKPKMGKQPEPIPGVHNSGWRQSPGYHVALAYENNTLPKSKKKDLENYIKGVLAHFKNDDRILGWDLYNEVGQEGCESEKLLRDTWKWAWAVRPKQPLTACVGGAVNEVARKINAKNSDVYSFHSYSNPENFVKDVELAKEEARGRPVLCTEYMARTTGNTFQACMPIMKEENIACWNWGLVDGKSGTKWPWSSRKFKPGDSRPTPVVDPQKAPENPEIWHHDILNEDGTPYKKEEVDFIRHLTGAKK